jgi:hypothetical protein
MWLNFETLKYPGAWALRKCELVRKDNASQYKPLSTCFAGLALAEQEQRVTCRKV